MPKIFKQFGYNVDLETPVAIDNTVYIPLTPEEAALSADERKNAELERKAAEEKNLKEAVDAEVKRILDEQSIALEYKRSTIIEEAKKQANAISEDAKKTTAAVLEKTSKECVLLMEQAKKDGYNEGYQNGHKESLEKCKKYIDGAAKLLAEINTRKEAYYISNEKELRDTVFMMTQKIVKAELEVNPLVVERIIADAAKGYRNSDYIKISVSDGEISEKIKTDKTFINKLIPFIKDIEIEVLPEAENGTIILDDDQNIVDASIPTQLDFLKEILKNTRGEEET